MSNRQYVHQWCKGIDPNQFLGMKVRVEGHNASYGQVIAVSMNTEGHPIFSVRLVKASYSPREGGIAHRPYNEQVASRLCFFKSLPRGREGDQLKLDL